MFHVWNSLRQDLPLEYRTKQASLTTNAIFISEIKH